VWGKKRKRGALAAKVEERQRLEEVSETFLGGQANGYYCLWMLRILNEGVGGGCHLGGSSGEFVQNIEPSTTRNKKNKAGQTKLLKRVFKARALKYSSAERHFYRGRSVWI
jgi:hypothetical protein